MYVELIVEMCDTESIGGKVCKRGRLFNILYNILYNILGAINNKYKGSGRGGLGAPVLRGECEKVFVFE